MIETIGLALKGVVVAAAVGLVPGIIWSRAVLREEKMNLAKIFGWSLLYNFLKVLGLALVGLCTTAVMSGLAVMEGVGLIYVLIRQWRERWSWEIGRYEIMILLAVAGLAMERVALALFYPFTVGDVWASWNNWAVTWSRLTVFSWENGFTYPQLLPMAWASIYKLAGGVYPGEYYAHALTILFSVLTLWLLLRWREASTPISALVLGGYFLANKSSFFSVDLGSGLADLPMTFFVLLSLYYFSEWRAGRRRQDLYGMWLSAAAAALTKQGGLFFWLMLMPLAIWTARDKWREMVRPGLISLGLVAVWYGGQNLSQAATVGQIREALADFGLGERLAVAAYITVQNFGVYLNVHEQPLGWVLFLMAGFYAAVAGGLIIAMRRNSFYSRLFLVYVLPQLLIWAWFYSYDIRNGIAALLITLFMATDGWVGQAMVYKNEWMKVKMLRYGVVGLAFLGLVGLWRQPVIYAHQKNPFSWEGIGDDLITKKGRLLLNEDLVKIWRREEGAGRLLTNDSTFTTKLHLAEAAVRPFWKEGRIEESEELRRLVAERELVLAWGEGKEHDLWRRWLDREFGQNGWQELYKGEKWYLVRVEGK